MAKYLDSTGLNQLWTACKGLFLTAATGDQRYICSFNNASTNPSIDTFINYQCLITQADSGSWGGGTQPSGAHNGLGILNVHTHTGYYYTQLALDTNQNYLWIRSCNNGESYGSWERLAKASELSWSSISGKPSTFTPSSHTHDYLYTTQVSQEQANVTWAKGFATNYPRSFVYNTNGIEYSYLVGMNSNDNYGTILKMGYTDRYLRILRKTSGTWQSDDWEKIYAGYADSAGSASSVAWSGITGKPSTFAPSSHTHSYLPLSGGTITGDITFSYGMNTSDQMICFTAPSSDDPQTCYLGIRRPVDSYGPSYKDRSGNWYCLLHEGNYTSYTVKKDGTGASGTWGISISGNAASASNVDWSNVSNKPTALSNSEIDGIIV